MSFFILLFHSSDILPRTFSFLKLDYNDIFPAVSSMISGLVFDAL